jgi:cytochrome c oxidase subunit 2
VVPTREEFEDVWHVYLPIAGAVFLIVVVTVLFFLWRYRERRDPDRKPYHKVEHNLVEGGYAAFLVLVVAFLVAFTFLHENRIDGFTGGQRKPADLASAPTLTVDVIAAKWNWRFHYEGTDVIQVPAAPNRPTLLYVPAGRTIHFNARSQDVLHQFWVPAVRYKRAVWPDHVEQFNLAFPPGRHLGECAWFCGLYHESMQFQVVALPPDEFQAWLQRREAQAGTT